MKLYYLLEKGDIIQETDEVHVGGKWVKTKYPGRPNLNGCIRRNFTPEVKIDKETGEDQSGSDSREEGHV